MNEKPDLRIVPQPDGQWFVLSGGQQVRRGDMIVRQKSTIEARCQSQYEAERRLAELRKDVNRG